jgi:hypothetical protein
MARVRGPEGSLVASKFLDGPGAKTLDVVQGSAYVPNLALEWMTGNFAFSAPYPVSARVTIAVAK